MNYDRHKEPRVTIEKDARARFLVPYRESFVKRKDEERVGSDRLVVARPTDLFRRGRVLPRASSGYVGILWPQQEARAYSRYTSSLVAFVGESERFRYPPNHGSIGKRLEYHQIFRRAGQETNRRQKIERSCPSDHVFLER